MEDYKNCTECGARFTVKRRDNRFCCAACAKKWWSKKNYPIVSYEPIRCKYCGEFFTPVRKGHKYCSPGCKDNSCKKVEYSKICKVCGQSFITTNSIRKYCYGCYIHRSRGNKRIKPEIKFKILKGQKNLCWLCHGKLEDSNVILHHLDISGQTDSPNNEEVNIVALHVSCHRSMHNISIARIKDKWVITGDVFNYLSVNNVEVKR